MNPLLIDLFEQGNLAQSIAAHLSIEIANFTLRNFPDGETYIKIESNCQNREIIVLASLEHPNVKILPLLFLARTLHTLGVKRIGLCAPYLAYMRQDKQFNAGEGITSEYFAELLSHYFDWLVTIDPHLHRHLSLNEIYSIPNTVIHAAPAIAKWIANNVKNPLLIGPDMESEQWVKDVAKKANAPYLILEKVRLGDREVNVSQPEIEAYHSHTPILIDDIISTGHTLLATIKQLTQLKMKPPICIGIHGIFADEAYDKLLHAGVAQIVTSNTISHPSNQIDLSFEIANEIKIRYILV